MSRADPRTDLDRFGSCRGCEADRLLYNGLCDECWNRAEAVRAAYRAAATPAERIAAANSLGPRYVALALFALELEHIHRFQTVTDSRGGEAEYCPDCGAIE